MNILGIGGWEFVVILIIMLIIAGPKRMIHWAYILGRYMGKLRIMWAETMTILQKEFDEAGLDVNLPKEPPTRQNINQSISRMADKTLKPFSEPLRQTVEEVEAEARKIAETTSLPHTNGHKTPPPDTASKNTDAPASNDKKDFGTWSGKSEKHS